MSNPTLAAQKKGDMLSETAKAKLREIWREEVWSRKNYDTKNKYTNKGIECEPDAFDLIKKVTGTTYFKNNEEFHNGYIKGTPDIVTAVDVISDATTKGILIRDTKCSWSLATFMEASEKKAYTDYFWQQLGYMWLKGAVGAYVDYCLVNTPESIMTDELYRLSFNFPEINGSDEKLIEPFKRLFIFDDIPDKMRLKSYYFGFRQEDVTSLVDRIGHARQYLSELTL